MDENKHKNVFPVCFCLPKVSRSPEADTKSYIRKKRIATYTTASCWPLLLFGSVPAQGNFLGESKKEVSVNDGSAKSNLAVLKTPPAPLLSSMPKKNASQFIKLAREFTNPYICSQRHMNKRICNNTKKIMYIPIINSS